MSFDFDMYDPEAYEEEKPLKSNKKPVLRSVPEEQPQQATTAEPSFDFDMYDSESFPSSEGNSKSTHRTKNPFETPILSKDEYDKLSFRERMAYAQDLEKDLKYRHSEDVTKNLASGLSLGYSEDVPGLELNEDQDPVAAFTGHAIGAALPITGASKLVGYGLKGVSQAVKQGPKVLQYLNNLAHAFGTGSVYEAGKQGVNATTGKEVDLLKIPTTGAEFVAGDALIRGLGALGKKFLKLSPSHQAKILEEGIIPTDLPKSQYETAEEVLGVLRKQNGQKDNFPRPGGPPPPPDGGPPPPPSRINPSRVSTNAKDLGLRPTPSLEKPDLSNQVGDLFSKERFYNTTQGGQAFKNEIIKNDENVYRGVNELYKNSRELNSKIENIQPQLIGKLESSVAHLKEIPEPSDVQKRLLRASQRVMDRLVEYESIKDEAGNVIGKEIVGYKPINNQTLIDQVQSLRQIIDYDFAHGNTKNIFRPLINDLENAAIESAEQVGVPEAAEALKQAKNAYRLWVEAFDNDYVRPFRDASNKDYSKLFKSALDFDESNMLRKILGLSENGQRLANASVREIVDKQLGKFFDNPRQYNSSEFNKTLRELGAVITPEQANQVKEQFRQAQGRASFNAKQQPKRPQTNEEVIAAKYEGKEPEDIQNMMNSRTGIKKLRQDLGKSPERKAVFERLQKQKMRSILREGNIEKEFTGDDLYRFLNKEHNYELFSEMLGEQETEALRLSAKEIGKEQVRSEVRKKNISKAAHKVASLKALELLLGLF